MTHLCHSAKRVGEDLVGRAIDLGRGDDGRHLSRYEIGDDQFAVHEVP